MKKILYGAAVALLAVPSLTSFGRQTWVTYWFSVKPGVILTLGSPITNSQVIYIGTSDPASGGCSGAHHYCKVGLTVSQVNIGLGSIVTVNGSQTPMVYYSRS